MCMENEWVLCHDITSNPFTSEFQIFWIAFKLSPSLSVCYLYKSAPGLGSLAGASVRAQSNAPNKFLLAVTTNKLRIRIISRFDASSTTTINIMWMRVTFCKRVLYFMVCMHRWQRLGRGRKNKQNKTKDSATMPPPPRHMHIQQHKQTEIILLPPPHYSTTLRLLTPDNTSHVHSRFSSQPNKKAQRNCPIVYVRCKWPVN